MSVTLEAVVENGLFRPLEQVSFAERERVEITVRRLTPPADETPPVGENRAEAAADEEEYDPRGILSLTPPRPVVARTRPVAPVATQDRDRPSPDGGYE